MRTHPLDILTARDDTEATRLGFELAQGYRRVALAALDELRSVATCHDRLSRRYLVALDDARELRAQVRTT